MRTYRFVHGAAAAIAETAERDLVSVFRGQNGFLDYRLTVMADDRAVSASTREAEELAAVAAMLELDWVRVHLAERLDGLPDVFIGKVVVGAGGAGFQSSPALTPEATRG